MSAKTEWLRQATPQLVGVVAQLRQRRTTLGVAQETVQFAEELWAEIQRTTAVPAATGGELED
jgi:hypothetical protein